MNEFDIIRRYFTRPTDDPGVVLGVGDDAAVLAPAGRIVLTVDTLLADVHFPADAAPDAIGHRALAVSLSDVAAMGARPRWCTLALTLPRAEAEWLEAFSGGFFTLAERFGVSLIGGNLTNGPLSITVDAIGELAEDALPLTRAGGRAGDDVYVTGTLGDAAGGLALIRRNGGAASGDLARTAASLLSRYSKPMPRVEAGIALGKVASAAIDVSDGLAADLGHLCKASGCGAEIDVEALPFSEALHSLFTVDEAVRLALSGGDDYELCFTAAPDAAGSVAAVLGPTGVPFRRIGRLTEGGDIEFVRRGERIEPQSFGYLHFK